METKQKDVRGENENKAAVTGSLGSMKTTLLLVLVMLCSVYSVQFLTRSIQEFPHLSVLASPGASIGMKSNVSAASKTPWFLRRRQRALFYPRSDTFHSL